MNEWLEKNKAVVLAALAALILITLAIFAFRWRAPEPVVIQPPAATNTPGPIRVYVSGSVVHPDVYSLLPGSIVKDAIAAAGGASSDADLNKINLAQSLSDGQQIYVPHMGEISAQPLATDSAASVSTGPININTASQAELESLPHIGPSLAARIIQYREKNGPFATIDDIKKVSGIGPSIFGEIKDLITVK